MKRILISFLLAIISLPLLANSSEESSKLSGTIIGTSLSINYNTNSSSTTVNTKAMAFDGNLNTYFASYERSNTWCGLDLGTPHVITKVGWSPRNDSNGPSRVNQAIFEGANMADFSDAMPILMVKENGTIGQIKYADVNVSRGFRYVRYVGPNNARCNIAELEFYGYEGEGDDSHFYQATNLPLVVINVLSGNDPVDKETKLESRVKVISKQGTKLVYDTAVVSLRGNTSKDFPKKPYKFKFNSKHKLCGSPAKAKRWTLINNYGDKTLMRNLIAFELSKRLQLEYTPFGVPVDVIMNGEYKGCYQLCDQIEVHKDRVEVEEMTPTAISGDSITGGYLVEIDAYAYDELSWFNSNRNNPVTIKYPDDDDIVSQQQSYIKGRFNTMESRLFSTNFTNETSGYRPYLDLDSFIKHFLVGEMSGNTDTYWSVYMYKHRNDDHFYTGPVWDFDLAFENDNRTYPLTGKTDFTYRSGGSCAGNMRSFVDRIVKSDNAAKARMKELWSYSRNDHGLCIDTLVQYVNDMADSLTQSMTLNFKRWPILNTRVHQNPKTYGSYKGEVNNVINYITHRVTWMDNKVGYDASITSIGNIKDPACQDKTDIRIFNLSGIPQPYNTVEELPCGVYIIKQGSKTTKIMVGN